MTALSRVPRDETRWCVVVTFLNKETKKYWEPVGKEGRSAENPLKIPEGEYTVGLDWRCDELPYKYEEWHVKFPDGVHPPKVNPLFYKIPSTSGDGSWALGIDWDMRISHRGRRRARDIPEGYAPNIELFECKMGDVGGPCALKMSPTALNGEVMFHLVYWLNLGQIGERKMILFNDTPQVVPP